MKNSTKPISVLGLLLLIMVQGFTQNDPCSAHLLEYDILVIGDNSFAQASEIPVPCFSDGSIDNDLWWSFEASSNGALISTTDVGLGNQDTQLAIYSSSDNTCTGNFSLISCNEDISAKNWMSSARVCDLVPGDTYFVQVDGWGGAKGGFEIEIKDAPGCVTCDPSDSHAGDLTGDSFQEICPGDRAWFSLVDFDLPDDLNCQATGGIFVLPADPSATGGPFNGKGFIWTNPDMSGQLEYIERNSFGHDHPLEGTWELSPAVFSDHRLDHTYDEADSSIKVEFLSTKNASCPSDTICVAGTLSNQDQVTCQESGSVDLTLSSDHAMPTQSDFYWFIQNEERSITYTYNFGNDPSFYQYIGNLNQLLELNGQPTLGPGAWFMQGAIVENVDMDICDVTDVVIITVLGIEEEGCEIDLCSAFTAPPVGLSKSFDPVNGVQDRVQLKWYKAEPKIPYTDEDAAMCDIQFWGIRTLDPETGAVTGIIDPVDTVQIANVKKTYPDNSPREIFKWPVKYYKEGVNNNKRVDPNKRYLWRVRCECGHDGNGPESPWSEIKLFNTPDFDPITGIYSGSGGISQEISGSKVSDSAVKRLRPSSMNSYAPISNLPRIVGLMDRTTDSEVRIYPNPANATLDIELQKTARSLQVRDAVGRIVLDIDKRFIDHRLNISSLSEGIYFLELDTNGENIRRPFVVKR